MEKSSADRAAHIVEKSPHLAGLVKAAAALDRLEREITRQMGAGDQDQDHIRIARIDGDCLVLAATSPAWASRARLAAADYLEAARAVWPSALRQTRVIVVPNLVENKALVENKPASR